MDLKKVVICGGVRTPFVKSFGHYKNISTQDLMTTSLKALVKKFNLEKKVLDEVILGAVMKGPMDFNLARESVLGSGLSPFTPAFDIQRACGTSLQAAIILSNKIKLGQIECGIAGGVDSNSAIPLLFSNRAKKALLSLQQAKTISQKLSAVSQFRPSMLSPKIPSVQEPRTKKSMGEHCELMAKEWKITREEQDQQALYSQRKAAQAYQDGFYEDLITPTLQVVQDQFVRPGTSPQKMKTLSPAFDKKNGSLTAANSTPLTDGSSAVFMCSDEYAKKHQLPILAEFVDGQAAAVDFVAGDGLLMAPTIAVSKMLKRLNLKLQDYDLYEIHEAFSAQLLCTLKAWEDPKYCQEKMNLESPLGSINKDQMNLVGGSVALGHPFAATGARLISTSAKLISEKKGSLALLSACTAGGMGVVATIKKYS